MPHSHHDNHSHDVISTLSFAEKMIKRLEHWQRHNDSHAETYKEWAEKAKENDMDKVGSLLEDVFEMTMQISKKFDEALTVAGRGK
jgi:hypothetical protein